MRLALLSHLASPVAPTGAERSLALLARGLAGRGHRVTVTVPGRWALAEELERDEVRVETIPVRACWLVAPDRQPAPLLVLRALRYAIPDRGSRHLGRCLARVAPEAVLVNCLPHLRGAAAARRLGLPVVWHVREILPPGPRRRLFAARLARDASRVVAVSEAVAGWLREDGLGGRVTVVHNPVEPPAELAERRAARDLLGLPDEGCLVAFLGQLIPHKGIGELVRAAPLVAESTPEASWLVAGRGRPQVRARLARELERAAGRGRVHLVSPRDDVWPLLAASDVVVVPSLAADPLPRAVLEAMAARRPVVAYAGGGVEEMLRDGETGLVVGRGDVGALAARVAELCASPELRHTIGAAAEAEAGARFTLAGHLDRMEAVLGAAARRSAAVG